MNEYINKKVLTKYAPLLVLIGLIIIVTLINPNFMSLRNFARLSISTATPLMIAIGVTFTIILGSIDLSMEGVIAFCGTSLATLMLYFGSFEEFGWLAIPITLLLGLLIGTLTGFMHTTFKIPSFITSLSIGYVTIGLAMYMTDGIRIQAKDKMFRLLLTERIYGMPLMFYFAILALIIAYIIQTRTTLGRNIYAIGGNEKLAYESGVNVKKTRIMTFGLAGFFYAIGTIFAVARIGSVASNIGNGFMFISITSAVVGGTTLIGGKGGVIQALIGVMIVSVIGNGMVLLGLPRYIQEGVLGVIIIIAISVTINRKSIEFIK